MTYNWPNSAFFNFQEYANQENCRQFSCILFLFWLNWNKEPDEEKIYCWTEFFHKLDNNKWKMHTGTHARRQKYISIYISLDENLFENGYVSDWISKNMAKEISLIYLLTDCCSGACFLFLLFIYLICTEYLLNRLQYVDFDEFLTGINLPPPFAPPPPKERFIRTSHNSLCMSIWN